MVWPFSRKKVIDLTKDAKVSMPVKKLHEQDYKDFTNADAEKPSDVTNAFSFLSNIASSSSAENSSAKEFREISKSSPQHLKVRIDDIEYKLDSLRTRIDKIIERLELAERKIDRNDRR